MTVLGPLELLAFVICDDVRREDNGKEMLIGIYGSDVRMPALPQIASLTFWGQFRFIESRPTPIHLRIVDDELTEFANISNEIPAGPVDAIISFGLIDTQFPISSKTTLHCELATDGDWQRVRSILIKKADQIQNDVRDLSNHS